MVASILQLFIRLNKVRILPIIDSYLLINNFKKPPKMSREVIETNYRSLSPFEKSNLTPLGNGNNLLIWFSPSDSVTLSIPEAYVLYKALLSRSSQDRIAVFSTTPKIVIVLKENLLIAQSVCPSDDSAFLEKLKRAHSITVLEHYTQDEYNRLFSTGLSELSLNDYTQFFSLELPELKSFKTTFENLSTPLSVLILGLLGYHYALNYHLSQKLEESRQAYQEGRGAMVPIKHRLDNVKNHREHWDTFINQTLIRPDALHASLPILRAAAETNTTIKYIKSSAGKSETVVETSNATIFLKRLVATGKYESVKLDFTKTDPLRHIDNAKIITHIFPYDANGTSHEH